MTICITGILIDFARQKIFDKFINKELDKVDFSKIDNWINCEDEKESENIKIIKEKINQ